MTTPRLQATCDQLDAGVDRDVAAVAIRPDRDHRVGHDLAGGHDGVDCGPHLLHAGAVWLFGAMVRDVALVEDIGVDVQIDEITALGEIAYGPLQILTWKPGGWRGNDDVGG